MKSKELTSGHYLAKRKSTGAIEKVRIDLEGDGVYQDEDEGQYWLIWTVDQFLGLYDVESKIEHDDESTSELLIPNIIYFTTKRFLDLLSDDQMLQLSMKLILNGDPKILPFWDRIRGLFDSNDKMHSHTKAAFELIFKERMLND